MNDLSDLGIKGAILLFVGWMVTIFTSGTLLKIGSTIAAIGSIGMILWAIAAWQSEDSDGSGCIFPLLIGVGVVTTALFLLPIFLW